ncbi:MAG: tripartite tricarboxylate transporter substrate-binding protein [Pseudorhodoferax sp.]
MPYNSNSPYTDLHGRPGAADVRRPAGGGRASIRAGKLKLLGITGKARHPSFPDVPTFAEQGLPDYAPIAWQGVLAPAGTPPAILDKLSAAMAKVCQSPDLARRSGATTAASCAATRRPSSRPSSRPTARCGARWCVPPASSSIEARRPGRAGGGLRLQVRQQQLRRG